MGVNVNDGQAATVVQLIYCFVVICWKCPDIFTATEGAIDLSLDIYVVIMIAKDRVPWDLERAVSVHIMKG